MSDIKEKELETLRLLSPYSLPDNPSQYGWTPKQIKAKLYEGLEYLLSVIYDVTDRLEVPKLVGETQLIKTLINQIISGEVIVGRAKADSENKVFKNEYSRIVDLTNGTVAVLNYINKDGNPEKIADIVGRLETFMNEYNQFILQAFDNLEIKKAKYAETSLKDNRGNVIDTTYETKADAINKKTELTAFITDIAESTRKSAEKYTDEKTVKLYKAKGSVNYYSELPTTNNVVGDVYNIVNADKTHDIDAGENVVWTDKGTWDKLGGKYDHKPIFDSINYIGTGGIKAVSEYNADTGEITIELLDFVTPTYDSSTGELTIEATLKEII